LAIATGKSLLVTSAKDTLREAYARLLSAYGPQHWWPAEGPFEVMVGAILTQSTAWANVAKAIENLKCAGAMTPQALRRLSVEDVAALIRPCGYYVGKTRKLKALVAWLDGQGDDLTKILAEDTEDLRRELLGVYGIGEETADSILLYAAGKPVFVVDAYTRRIVDRIGIQPERDGYAAYQRLFVENLWHDTVVFNEYHALLVEHGKRTCRKAPRCDGCCLLDICSCNGEKVRRTARAGISSSRSRHSEGIPER
jgi:endonuclease III related protein